MTVGQALSPQSAPSSPSAVVKRSLCVFYWSSWPIRYLYAILTGYGSVCHLSVLTTTVSALPRGFGWGREGQIPQCGVRYLMADVLTLQVKAGCAHVVVGSTVSLSIDPVF